MQELADKQIERQDFVDTAVFELIRALNPTSTVIEWNIEMISEVRENIRCWLVEKLKICDEMSFYPYVEE